MRTTYFWHSAAAAGLLFCTGCVSGGLFSLPDTTTASDSASTRKAELAPAKAAKVQFAVAENMEKSGNDADAIVCYEMARKCDPKTPVSIRLAPLYDRVGETKRALEEYQLALKANPRDANLRNNYGYFFYTRGQWHDAETQFRAALELDGKHARAWTNLGMTLAQQDRQAESLSAFEKVVSPAEARSNLAFILTAQGKKEEAVRAYQEALRLNPNLQIARIALQKLLSPPQAPAANSVAQAGPRPAPITDMTPIVVDPTRGNSSEPSNLAIPGVE